MPRRGRTYKDTTKIVIVAAELLNTSLATVTESKGWDQVWTRGGEVVGVEASHQRRRRGIGEQGISRMAELKGICTRCHKRVIGLRRES